ncbi:MAG: RdgB/HAM1 family non-canonical purine NTP pyrophosphatase [Orrella sp.]|jgi:XTP/dITP diphosphohydrolase|uniref:RdgB/HAM1 family non-canonical purine NTP pyrophosphatase n=1 Tax=Orrella sp. TaxID=1921583 RepID=UPI003BC9DF6E
MLSQLVLATANPGKRREFDRLLAPLGVSVLDQASLGVDPAPEPYTTFLENALTKARHASSKTGLPALADDSGICVSALSGAPGVHSARFAEPMTGLAQDKANNQKLVASLNGVTDRQAMYVAILVLVLSPDDPLPIVAQGSWTGQVIDQPRGEHGFGYDPHFLLPELGLTAAELHAAQKNEISHRAQAMRILINTLRERVLIRE